MPTFSIKAPDGKTYNITGENADGALAALKKHLGQTEVPQAQAQDRGILGNIADTMRDASVGSMQGRLFGFGDEIAAGMLTPIEMGVRAAQGKDWSPSATYGDLLKDQRAQLETARERSPIATALGDIAGGMATAGDLSKGGMTLLNGASPTYPSMIGRGLAEGAAYGATRGAGEGEGARDRIVKALTGGAIGGAFGAGAGALGARSAYKAARAARPGADDLAAMASQAYDDADAAGVIFTPNALDRIKADIHTVLANKAYRPELQPKIASVLKALEEDSGKSLTFKGMETLRRVAGNAYDPMNKSSNSMLNDIIDAIDNVVANPQTGEILSGNTPQAQSAITQARDLYRRSAKSKLLDEAMNAAKLRTAHSGTGGNEDNYMRQRLTSLLTNPKKQRGFTADELGAMRQAVEGSKVQNALRTVGRLSPTTGGLSAMLHTGAAAAGAAPYTVPAAAVGYGAKTAADAMTRGNIEQIANLIATGSKKLAPQQLPASTMALIEALISGTAQQSPKTVLSP